MPLPVQMRAVPSASLSGALQVFDGTDIAAAESIAANYGTADWLEVDLQLVSPLNIGRPAVIFVSGQKGTIDLDAELQIV
jgi:hypothetical protein